MTAHMCMQVASYMRAVLRTLAQCHSHHILHRDIKPGECHLSLPEACAPISHTSCYAIQA